MVGNIFREDLILATYINQLLDLVFLLLTVSMPTPSLHPHYVEYS